MKLARLLLLALGVSSIACSANPADEESEPLGSVESAATASCSPSRAVGAVNKYQKALHDSIAYAEGTEGRGKDGYDITFAYRRFTSCAKHPNMRVCDGLCSTAAGRYQFLTRTWNTTARAIGATTFEPNNQEKGAAYLISRVRRVNVPTGRAMTAAELANAMSKLSYEWASLPPGRYGQPTKTSNQMRTDYCRNVGGC